MGKIFLRKSSKGGKWTWKWTSVASGLDIFIIELYISSCFNDEKSENVEKIKDNFISIIERRDLKISLVGYQEVLVEFSLLE